MGGCICMYVSLFINDKQQSGRKHTKLLTVFLFQSHGSSSGLYFLLSVSCYPFLFILKKKEHLKPETKCIPSTGKIRKQNGYLSKWSAFFQAEQSSGNVIRLPVWAGPVCLVTRSTGAVLTAKPSPLCPPVMNDHREVFVTEKWMTEAKA